MEFLFVVLLFVVGGLVAAKSQTSAERKLYDDHYRQRLYHDELHRVHTDKM